MVKVPVESNELYEILKATNKEKPAKADIQRLESYFMQHPSAVEKLGNLANQVQIQIVDHAFSTSAGTAISVESYMADLRLEMGYDDAPVILRGLIDHVVLCWLRLYITELRYERNMESGNLTVTQGEYWEKKLTQNQKRYLRAVETLARIRKLQQPAPNPLTLALIKQQFNAGTEPPTKKLGKWIR